VSAVYRDFTQASLDAAYNNRAAEPGLEAIKADWDRRSQAIYARAKVNRDLAYGKAPRQRLDFFHAASKGRPTVAWIHGGYWQTNEKEPNAFIAEGMLAHDLNVALLEYTLAPAATMTGIVAEIRAAIGWLVERLQPEFGAGRGLVVAGHSAGGHLTAMAAAEPGVTAAVPISGLFDLEPIRLSYLNALLRMDVREAGTNSPMRLPFPQVPLTVAVGGAELPELIRQSEDFHSALEAAGRPVGKMIVPKATHFTILEEVARPSGALANELARLAAF
jgi:arylformamidase